MMIWELSLTKRNPERDPISYNLELPMGKIYRKQNMHSLFLSPKQNENRFFSKKKTIYFQTLTNTESVLIKKPVSKNRLCVRTENKHDISVLFLVKNLPGVRGKDCSILLD